MAAWLFAHLSRAKTDNILHLLVRDTKWSRLEDFSQILTSLLGHMNRSNLSVDVTDCERRRALELSIRTDNLEAMKLLLDHEAERGLNDGHSYKGQMSPLDLAMEISDDLGLMAELMHRTRKAQGLQPENALILCVFENTIHRLDLTIASSTREAELHDAYIVFEQIALYLSNEDKDYVLQMEDTSEILRILLVNWDSRQLSISELDGRKWAHDCLEKLIKIYLSGNTWDALQLSNKDRDGCRCKSAIAFAVFHVQDRRVTDSIVRQLTDRDVDRFLSRIVPVCPVRHRRCDAEHLCGLIRSVVNQQPEFNLEDALKWVIRETPDDLKPAFLDILVNHGTVDIHYRGGSETIAEMLVRTAESYRWKVVEKVLPHDPGFPSSTTDRTEAVFFHQSPNIHHRLYSSIAYLDHLCHWSTWKCRALNIWLEEDEMQDHDWAAQATCDCHKFIIENEGECENDSWGWQYRARDAREMQRCVIHVITKDLCNHTSLFARDMPLNERIRSALQLRQEFNLPNLEIEQSLLLEALSTPPSQPRVVEVQPEAMDLDLFGPSPAPQDEREGNAEPLG